jgi:hypothetical protein
MKWETAFITIDKVNEYLEQRVADRWFVSTVTPVSFGTEVKIFVASCQRPAKAKSNRWAKKKDSE